MTSSPSNVPGAETPRFDVFLSYASRDATRVRTLAQKLRDAGLAVWMDETGIDLATRWSQEIVEAISGARVFLLIATQHSLTSPNVAKELSLASEEKKRIFPVYLEDCETPASVRYQLAGVQRLMLFGAEEEAALERLLRALREACGGSADAATIAKPARPTRRWLLPSLGLAALLAVAGLAWQSSSLAFGRSAPSLLVEYPFYAPVTEERVRVTLIGKAGRKLPPEEHVVLTRDEDGAPGPYTVKDLVRKDGTLVQAQPIGVAFLAKDAGEPPDPDGAGLPDSDDFAHWNPGPDLGMEEGTRIRVDLLPRAGSITKKPLLKSIDVDVIRWTRVKFNE